MKITLTTVLIIILVSCTGNQKKMDSSQEELRAVTNKKNTLVFYNNGNNRLVKIRDIKKKIDYFFLNNDINRLSMVVHADPTKFINAEVKFDSINDSKKLSLYDEETDELIEDYYTNHQIKTIVYSYLPAPVDRQIRTSSFTVQNNDTSDYFFFERLERGVKIRTDDSYFIFNPDIMDSVEIVYSSNVHSISFYSPEDHFYLPNMKNAIKNRILNNLIIPSNENLIVGTLWTFFNQEKKGEKYSYNIIYFQGDLMKRIARKRSGTYGIQFLKAQTIDNTQLKKELIESGGCRVNGNKLELLAQ
jgi:hypothetical protein